jgi:cytochrome c551
MSLKLIAAIGCMSLMSCIPNPEAVKFKQYYRKGESLYEQHCSNCHQADGSGLRRLYPPLDTSDYMTNRFKDVVCAVKYGKTGEITVNGITFNQAMPAFPTLSDLEIAEITTYIYNTWSHDKGLVDVREVSGILSECN